MSQNKTPEIVTVTAGDSRPPINIANLLNDRGQTRLLRRTLVGIVGGVFVLLAWGIVAQVDELARARGEVQPGGHIQTLQTQDGGTIVKLYVKEGDNVKAGQVIADFAVTDIEKLRAQTEIKLNAAAIERERILSVLENRKVDFSKYEKDYPLLVEQARANLESQQSLIAGANRERGLIDMEIREARDRLNRLEEGARKGVVTQLAVSDARQQLSGLEGRRATSDGATRYRQQMNDELGKLTEQYRELLAEKKAVEARQGRLQIKSPIDGIVIDLPQTAEGAVIPPGGVVADVVPGGQELVMEVMASPRDIGFIRAGQNVKVKVDSFDSARFGAIDGKVKRVAPTSSKMKENGAPFYKVEVALDKPYVGDKSRRLVPGMTGEADIATGRKSVMQYLLKPIFLASDTAFHER